MPSDGRGGIGGSVQMAPGGSIGHEGTSNGGTDVHAVGLGGAGGGCAPGAGGVGVDAVTSTDAAGTATTVRLGGTLSDASAEFNRSLGSNGRSCATCHLPDQAMSLTPAGAVARFNATDGLDPLFRSVDGAVSPLADVSSVETRRAAYALLLSKGLIRVGMPVPTGADFDLVAVTDPYNYASPAELSLFRRPLPSSNLRFLSTVMWDGREGLITGDDASAKLQQALASQASHAVLGHGQAVSAPSYAEISRIVDFEMSTFSAQASSLLAGPLDAFSALGGPGPLTQQMFFPGINDPNAMSPPFNPAVFSTFAPWQSTDQQGPDADARLQISLGETIFNTRVFAMTGVAGLTTAAEPSVHVTCSVCHNAPGAGSSSTARFFDLGLATAARASADFPLYTLQQRGTGSQVTVSDPGRALVTGNFSDVATFKVPTLRGLAARPPYFHNGSAATLANVVGFYNGRFNIGLTTDEKAALTAFLSAL